MPAQVISGLSSLPKDDYVLYCNENSSRPKTSDHSISVERFIDMNELAAQRKQDYAREKLWQCLECLIGSGTLKQRLNWANDFYRRLMKVHFPDRLHNDFLELEGVLNVNSAELAGVPTDKRLSNAGAKKAASAILRLYVELRGGI
jgi:hypothetical protein